MEKIINLENEKKFIKNKEHLSKEDYERLAEIETELKEKGKEIKDAFNQEKENSNCEEKFINNVRCLKLAENFQYGKTLYGEGRKILVDPTGYVVIPKFVFPIEFLRGIGVQETEITSFEKLAMKGL